MSSKAKKLLLAESQKRVKKSLRKQSSSSDVVKQLLSESKDRITKLSSLLREAGEYGRASLKDAGLNLQWEFTPPTGRIEEIGREMDRAFSTLIYNIINEFLPNKLKSTSPTGQQKFTISPAEAASLAGVNAESSPYATFPITPSEDQSYTDMRSQKALDDFPGSNIFYVLRYRHHVMPINDNEFLGNAQNALAVLQEILQSIVPKEAQKQNLAVPSKDIRQLVKAIENNNVSLNAYYQPGSHAKYYGNPTQESWGSHVWQKGLIDYFHNPRQREEMAAALTSDPGLRQKVSDELANVLQHDLLWAQIEEEINNQEMSDSTLGGSLTPAVAERYFSDIRSAILEGDPVELNQQQSARSLAKLMQNEGWRKTNPALQERILSLLQRESFTGPRIKSQRLDVIADLLSHVLGSRITPEEFIARHPSKYWREHLKTCFVQGKNPTPTQPMKKHSVLLNEAADSLRDTELVSAIAYKSRFYDIDPAVVDKLVDLRAKKDATQAGGALDSRIYEGMKRKIKGVRNLGVLPSLVQTAPDGSDGFYTKDTRRVSSLYAAREMLQTDLIDGLQKSLERKTKEGKRLFLQFIRYNNRSAKGQEPVEYILGLPMVRVVSDEQAAAGFKYQLDAEGKLVVNSKGEPIDKDGKPIVDQTGKIMHPGDDALAEDSQGRLYSLGSTKAIRGLSSAYLSKPELSILLQSLQKPKPDAEAEATLKPDRFCFFNQSEMSFCNGFDEYQTAAGLTRSKVLPNMRLVPSGELIPDTDSGNMLLDHLRLNWNRDKTGGGKQGLYHIAQEYKDWCKVALDALLNSSDLPLLLRQRAKTAKGGRQAGLQIVADAIEALLGTDAPSKFGKGMPLRQYTQADHWHDLLRQYHKWDDPADPDHSFKALLNVSVPGTVKWANQCDESLAKWADKNGKQLSALQDRPQPGQVSMQDFVGRLAPQNQLDLLKLKVAIEQIGRDPAALDKVAGQIAAKYSGQLTSHIEENPELKQQLEALCQFLVFESKYGHTKKGIPHLLPWGALSRALHTLTNLGDGSFTTDWGATGGLTAKNLAFMPKEQDFQLLRESAHPISKMMDLLSGLMHRSCPATIKAIDPETGAPYPESQAEKRFASGYSTSSGTGAGGEVIVGARFGYSAPEVTLNYNATAAALIASMRRGAISNRSPDVDLSSYQTTQIGQGRQFNPSEPFEMSAADEQRYSQPQQSALITRGITLQERISFTVGQTSGNEKSARSVVNARQLPAVLAQLEQKYPTALYSIHSQFGPLLNAIQMTTNRLKLSADRVRVLLNSQHAQLSPIEKATKTVVTIQHESDGTKTVVETKDIKPEYQQLKEKLRQPAPKPTPPTPAAPVAPQPAQQVPPGFVAPARPPIPTRPPVAPPVQPGISIPKTMAPVPQPPAKPVPPVKPRAESLRERIVRVADMLDHNKQTGFANKLDVLLKMLTGAQNVP